MATSTILIINGILLAKIPADLSKKLPSRGLVMIKVTLNTHTFNMAAEPDGKRGHWITLDNNILKKLKSKVGDQVEIQVESTKDWIEPSVPKDLKQELINEEGVIKLWSVLTPMARWEWIRWVNVAKQESTRARRIQVGISKLKAGSKRPCCFNGTECTVNSVSKNGVLIV
jgi:Bacteriocin-protection, YdeI or OmpD-Associated/Domain of unknown function (DUF1905)